MSPAGYRLGNRVRMYPPLVNNTTIDWFNEWPEEALLGVAENLMRDTEFVEYDDPETQKEIKSKVIRSFVDCHRMADKDCIKMLARLRRPFQLTPTTFFEFVAICVAPLNRQRRETRQKAGIYRHGSNTPTDTCQEIESMSLGLENKRQNVAVSQAKSGEQGRGGLGVRAIR